MPMGALWEYICGISGKVNMMLSPAREHNFQGSRGSQEALDGRLWAHSFWECVLKEFFCHFVIIQLRIVGRLGVRWGPV